MLAEGPVKRGQAEEARKFKLEGWRNSIREKLETLEDAYEIVSQNFRFSKEQFFDLMLQMGWWALILLELYSIFG